MSPKRLFLVAGLAILLFLVAGGWLYALSGGWRLLAAALLAALFWLLALREHRRFVREHASSETLRL